jgi:hypothetical protein
MMIDIIEDDQAWMLGSECALHRVWSADSAIKRPRADRAPADSD